MQCCCAMFIDFALPIPRPLPAFGNSEGASHSNCARNRSKMGLGHRPELRPVQSMPASDWAHSISLGCFDRQGWGVSLLAALSHISRKGRGGKLPTRARNRQRETLQ